MKKYNIGLILFVMAISLTTITSCELNLKDVLDALQNKEKNKDKENDKENGTAFGNSLKDTGLSQYSNIITYSFNGGTARYNVGDTMGTSPTDVLTFYVFGDTKISTGTVEQYASIMKTSAIKKKQHIDMNALNKVSTLLAQGSDGETSMTQEHADMKTNRDKVSTLLAQGSVEEKRKINGFLTSYTTTGSNGKAKLDIPPGRSQATVKNTLDFNPRSDGSRSRLDESVGISFFDIHPWKNSYKGKLKLEFNDAHIATYSKVKIYLGSNGKKASEWNWKNGDWKAVDEEKGNVQTLETYQTQYASGTGCSFENQLQGRTTDNYGQSFNNLGVKNYSESIEELSLTQGTLAEGEYLETTTEVGAYSVKFRLVCRRNSYAYRVYLTAPITDFLVYGVRMSDNAEVHMATVPIFDYEASRDADRYPKILTESSAGNYGRYMYSGHEIHYTDVAKGEAFKLGKIALGGTVPPGTRLQYKIESVYSSRSAIDYNALMTAMGTTYKAEFVADLNEISSDGPLSDDYIASYVSGMDSQLFGFNYFYFTSWDGYQGGKYPVSGVWLDYDENKTIPWSALAGKVANFSFRYVGFYSLRPSHSASTRVVVELPSNE